jgi:hypothetical protein
MVILTWGWVNVRFGNDPTPSHPTPFLSLGKQTWENNWEALAPVVPGFQ